ncbi:hypothetical protein AAFF_G00194370 [Aldrovandia affinis]|uniref:Uncharacterized protein n=1 Tax=Aldrovandia affinis TaxID=143900 RepID=A0AAD7WVJ3_9TELE|nr:hypothetical protein AAFF_G00194370 [Aldrovandia affinis]
MERTALYHSHSLFGGHDTCSDYPPHIDLIAAGHRSKEETDTVYFGGKPPCSLPSAQSHAFSDTSYGEDEHVATNDALFQAVASEFASTDEATTAQEASHACPLLEDFLILMAKATLPLLTPSPVNQLIGSFLAPSAPHTPPPLPP